MTTVATSCLITCKGRQGGVLQDQECGKLLSEDVFLLPRLARMNESSLPGQHSSALPPTNAPYQTIQVRRLRNSQAVQRACRAILPHKLDLFAPAIE